MECFSRNPSSKKSGNFEIRRREDLIFAVFIGFVPLCFVSHPKRKTGVSKWLPFQVFSLMFQAYSTRWIPNINPAKVWNYFLINGQKKIVFMKEIISPDRNSRAHDLAFIACFGESIGRNGVFFRCTHSWLVDSSSNKPEKGLVENHNSVLNREKKFLGNRLQEKTKYHCFVNSCFSCMFFLGTKKNRLKSRIKFAGFEKMSTFAIRFRRSGRSSSRSRDWFLNVLYQETWKGRCNSVGRVADL